MSQQQDMPSSDQHEAVPAAAALVGPALVSSCAKVLLVLQFLLNCLLPAAWLELGKELCNLLTADKTGVSSCCLLWHSDKLLALFEAAFHSDFTVQQAILYLSIAICRLCKMIQLAGGHLSEATALRQLLLWLSSHVYLHTRIRVAVVSVKILACRSGQMRQSQLKHSLKTRPVGGYFAASESGGHSRILMRHICTDRQVLIQQVLWQSESSHANDAKQISDKRFGRHPA